MKTYFYQQKYLRLSHFLTHGKRHRRDDENLISKLMVVITNHSQTTTVSRVRTRALEFLIVWQSDSTFRAAVMII